MIKKRKNVILKGSSNLCTGLERSLGLQQAEVPRFSGKSAHEGGKVVSTGRIYPPGDIPATHLS